MKRPVSIHDGSRPLADYHDPAEIRARIGVLLEKRRRLIAYNASVDAGRPDLGLLDEKQREIMGRLLLVEGQRFPAFIFRSVGRSLDILQRRLRRMERRAA